MTTLDQAWTAWRALNRIDRAKFLGMIREAYAREREAAAWERSKACGRPVARFLGGLSLTEDDLEAAAAARQAALPIERHKAERRA
ncbi:hypothetical protein ACQR09_23020 [Bradyrhizobium oligotrophicum]|uniref:hypothetical protein n=1 Tax=Bradyrhizobium oligotrophicum TaxID=44255 RepID=UPI003EB988DE